MHTMHFYFDFSLPAARQAFAELPQQLLGASYLVRYFPLGSTAAARAAWERAGVWGTPNRYVCACLFAGKTPENAPPGADAAAAPARQQHAEAAARAAGVQHLPALTVSGLEGQVFTLPQDWAALRAQLAVPGEGADTSTQI